MPTLVYAVEKPELPPFEMPARFKHDITYFVTRAGEQGVPADDRRRRMVGTAGRCSTPL